jgi:hypothetical protein
VIGAGDHHLSGFQRLTQCVYDLGGEFGKLIQEKHSVMGERDLAGPWPRAAAHQRRHARRMMRHTERTFPAELAAFNLARQTLNHGDFQHLLWFERRQETGQTLGKHGLAGSGRACHQNVMPSGRGDLDRALCHFLAAHIAEVEIVRFGAIELGHRTR